MAWGPGLGPSAPSPGPGPEARAGSGPGTRAPGPGPRAKGPGPGPRSSHALFGTLRNPAYVVWGESTLFQKPYISRCVGTLRNPTSLAVWDMTKPYISRYLGNYDQIVVSFLHNQIQVSNTCSALILVQAAGSSPNCAQSTAASGTDHVMLFMGEPPIIGTKS